ncbi:MAG TPA: ECF-type sigma factor, partial [Thermoanaerobaculia bacterium]|nr:ECF-type sigma factor [Thermoanaerobaculia bacterium]
GPEPAAPVRAVARRHRAGKRGGGLIKLPIDREVEASSSPESTDLVALHEALEQLAELDPRKAKVVELRYFGGMSLEETAEFLQVSSATVINDARFARAWLHRELSRGARDRPS